MSGVIAVVHVRHAPYDVYIGRAVQRQGFPSSKWGNPFKVSNLYTLEQVLAMYETYVRSGPLWDALTELDGKTLGCWCKSPKTPDAPCHGDVLARLVAERLNERTNS